MKLPYALLLLIAVACAQNNNPLKDPAICGRPLCKEGESAKWKFRYNPGTQHNYVYSVNVSSLFEGTSKNESSLFIEASIHVAFISHCDGVLTVTETKLSEKVISSDAAEARNNEEEDDYGDERSDGEWLHGISQLFGAAIQDHPLRFSFQDGVIAEVCPAPEELNWVLNFKKGILSMLHNSMERFDLNHNGEEDDVRGRCQTSYFVEESRGTSLIISKTKDLRSCEGRSKVHSMVQSTPYHFRANNKADNLLKSTSTCELSVDHRIYNRIECTEKYVFAPFSNEAAAASTILRQRLILVDEVQEPVQEQTEIERRSTLLYDHVPTPKPTYGELKSSRDLIRELCQRTTNDVQADFSDSFRNFIYTSRLLSYPALTALYEHSGVLCSTGKKHMLDALPYLGSSAAVALMKDLMVDNAVPETVSRDWMLNIALIPWPDAAMLESLLDLLKQKNDTSTALAVSSLVHTFCKQHEDCRFADQSADEIIQFLEDRATRAYESGDTDRDTLQTILVTLKAISNIGVVSGTFKETLVTMIEDNQLDEGIRVAAVDTHRRFPCEDDRSYFEDVMRNFNQNVEVRIAAYLQVMRCPNYMVLRRIRHVLEIEEVNQVGSFIWSHLHNLLRSSIPSRVEIQGLLSDEDLGKKFNSDVRKFSHNYEGSVFFEDYNVGANYESNVIFSPASYVPKSAMLNLTVELFGESINLLEVYGRMEGFEHYLESIFGPKGPLSSKNVQDKIPKMRWARSSASKAELIKSEINKLANVIENKFGEPKVSLGMKLFGNELKYTTLNGDVEIRDALHDLNLVSHLKRILSGKEINYSKAALFLDTSYVVSTGAGLPVSLNAMGSSSINLHLRGSLVAPNFIKTMEMDLKGNLKPSVAIDIVGTMSVDAYYANTAIKVKTSMYSSSEVDGEMKMRGSRLVSVTFGIPKKTNEIFGASSELVVMKNDVEEKQIPVSDAAVNESRCSWPAKAIIGVTFCADYHFMNVTKMEPSPRFILAGPSGFRIYLHKSDPTATTYVFQYRWIDLVDSSLVTVTFDTPGSSVDHVMALNLTMDETNRNLTLLLHTPEGSIMLYGKYRNAEMEKYLQMGLDINGERKFYSLLSLQKDLIQNGMLYKPKFYLHVNDEKVAESQGQVKLVSKSGISQYDVDLKFETKRLTSSVFGYVSRTEAAISTVLKLTYKFRDTNEHVGVLSLSLADRSSKNIVVYRGNAKIETSAYPEYNFNSSVTIQKSGGHIDAKMTLNSSPYLSKNLDYDPGMLTVLTFLTYRTRSNGTQFRVLAYMKRPRTELDVKAQFSYDSIGYSTTVMALGRYAKGRDVQVTLYWHRPRRTLESIETRLNVTIPDFRPMVLEAKLKEKNAGGYMVELDTQWFSGHSAEVRGHYQDKSTALASNHHLKFVLRSPSFTEINADCHYYQNNTEIKIDVKVDQQEDQYAVYLKHVQTSSYEMASEGSVKYKTKLYSISSSVSLREMHKILLELHIDQIRDIHLSMWAHNGDPLKEAGAELKWDANRDPNQKLAIMADYANEKPYKYVGNFYVSYPGRTIKGLFNFLLESGHFATLTQVAWSPDDMFRISMTTQYRSRPDIEIEVVCEVLTPFDEWRRSAVNGGFKHSGNMYRANGSMYWQRDQHISIDLFGDYEATGPALRCEFRGSLDSTVHDIPSLSASVKHNHNTTKVDSELHLTYDPKQKIDIASTWKIEENSATKNLTGTVTILTPFRGFNKGLLVSKICISRTRDIRAVANLDLDHKEVTISVEGHFQKLTKSMLVFNITTPIERFKLINGRFGFLEEQRYVVAKVSYPSGQTGVEVRFFVLSFSNFDIIFNLATPIEFLQEILIIGKLKADEADFRVGWNSLLAGFSGVWHYANVTDFEYSYKIFTPIEDFEENGIVAKLVYKEGLDFEVSLKLAENRLGCIVRSKPKPTLLKELGIKTQAIYNKKLNAGALYEYEEDGDSGSEEDEEDPFNWTGYAELNTIIYPRITAEVDIDQKGTIYDVVATLMLPAGKATLRDEFRFDDAFTIKNTLNLWTPYSTFRELSSYCDFKITIGHQYLLAFDFNYLNGTRWIETGSRLHYIRRVDREEDTVYNITLHLHTPLPAFPLIHINAGLLMEENAYNANFSMLTNNSDISFIGDVEMEKDLLEIDIKSHLNTPILVLPAATFSLRKDFSEAENRFECFYQMIENKSNRLRLSSVWKYTSLKNMAVRIELETPFRGVERTEAAIRLHVSNNKALAGARLVLFPIDIKADAIAQDNDLKAETVLEFNGNRHVIIFNGTISKATEGKQRIQGVMMSDGNRHDVNALLAFKDEFPEELSLTVMKPSGDTITVEHKIQQMEGANGFRITTTVQQGAKFARVNARIITRQAWDWDLHLRLETSHQLYNQFTINARAESSGGNRSLAADATTPFERLEKIKMSAFIGEGEHRKNEASASYMLGDAGGSLQGSWTWLLLENMSVKIIGNYQKPNYRRDAAISAFYINENKTFKELELGADVELNKNWLLGANVSFEQPRKGNYSIAGSLWTPKQNLERHTMAARLAFAPDLTDIEYLAKYAALYARRHYASFGTVHYRNNANLNGDITVEWINNTVRNVLDLHEKDVVRYFLYKLSTPKFKREALIANMTYQKWTDFHNITGELFYPGNRSVAVTRLSLKEFGNMNGFVNVSTPFKALNYTGADFSTETNALLYNRHLRVFWPHNDALLDAKCKTTAPDGSPSERNTKGRLLVEVPLTTRHIGLLDFDYTKKTHLTDGRATVEYNKDQILVAKYNCQSESREGFDKDTIHVELENKLVPIGADYIHECAFAAPGDCSNTPTADSKHINVYNLQNRTKLDVTGDVCIKTRPTGQEISLAAIHSNRTVRFTTTYDMLERQFKQSSVLELDPAAWIAYELDLMAKEKDATSEAQQIQINLSYPRRNFTALGSYNISDYSLSSEMILQWDGRSKVVQGGFDWTRDESRTNHHQILLELKHPSFEKNVTILGEYDRWNRTLTDFNVTIDYSLDPEHTLNMRGLLEDHSNSTMLNYTYGLWSSHPATKLDLFARGGVHYRPRWYYSHHLIDYKRTYLPLQSGEATTRLDIDNNDIELKRKTLHELSYLRGVYAGNFPLYTANVSAIHGKDINASGEFYLNFREKMVKLELNMTEDASQSLHMYGDIPDARSSYFDIWRDYEDIRVSDVSFFMVLNHSRLIVSKLSWRPELKQDIKDAVRALSVGLYNDVMDSSDYWRQYIRSETADAITDIWQDASPLIQDFLDDVEDLKTVEKDLQQLKKFLNDSYYANEFYIKDIVGVVLYAVDELSLKKHIENLPQIVSEIWEVMGESGKKIQKGIAWVIEKIKTYYKNAAEFINGLFQRDSMEHISEALKQLVEKYDSFMKDLHVSFIRYMEQLWNHTYKMLLDNWHKTLAAIEPTFIKFIHYLETILWNASKEVLDFLYIKKTEIVDNPYFAKISNFSRDFDVFYKDVTGNDTIGTIIKYTKVAWSFVKEKYFKLVPFSKELQQVIDEIVNEIHELENLPPAKIIIEKYQELEQKIKWVVQYFDLETRFYTVVGLIHSKLTDMKVTALEADNRYREAKTKFYFEPASGIMYWEQKLPMSLHAFNETPKFEEIPEYKRIKDIQDYFSASKMTFSKFYYDYKPFTDPRDWLPPFEAQAMLVDSRYYITFDRQVYDFPGEDGRSYLLASDLLDGNFSLVVSYGSGEPRRLELLVLLEDTLIGIDVYTNTIRTQNGAAHLPLQIGNSSLYQEAGIVKLESDLGFKLQCNMKFHVCAFEVSGWYFGKTAGLWGSMNNEPSDDLMASDRTRLTANDIRSFAESWALRVAAAPSATRVPRPVAPADAQDARHDVDYLCRSFFGSKVSPFATCFSRAPSTPFLAMCARSTTTQEACTSAVAYMKLCSYMNTPLRIPDACVKCNLANGSEVDEGQFVMMKEGELPRSTDVVFVVEAKSCNADVRRAKKLDELVQQLDRELQAKGLTHNRYAAVVFGGSGVHNRPRSVVINSTVFAEQQLIPSYFDHIPIGNGSLDIFSAISYAATLIFRPGVSKAVILLPCSHCHERHMRLEYSTLHQLLLENDITLHILMNEEFHLKKARSSKILFGVDRRLAYTKKDMDQLVGDAGLKKSVQMPKSTLGFCTALALETDGSVFSGKKLELEKLKSARKIAAVFGKRVAQSAAESDCKSCECTAHNSGISYMECLPCTYPSMMAIDYGFDEDEMLSVMQPLDDDMFVGD